ncbi:ATP-binding cassette domain-containing protein [Flammeovirga pacifica]|uniref:UvrABC system protein A n=1 Tax=Flammeovirga pacifica TaxID=915059 RepID=A0A1S1YWP4_FLAPC|nr:excinuclease ABC subunit UvrA [Flammeovirga pacifica]OHX65428.1 thiamine ABC transporter permease [Flammeovirga pacifica]
MSKIKIKGARQNNLKNISIDIPRNEIVVFTGLSGSGKSSLVFETITAEAQRQLYDTFSTFARSRLPKFDQADYDAIENLSPVILLEQKRISGNSRSNVGTLSEISSFLKLLFSRIGQPEVGMSNHFSPNTPEGMCPTCGGLGKLNDLEINQIIDWDKSLKEGAILFPDFKVNSLAWKIIANTGFFDLNTPLKEYSNDKIDLLFYADGEKFQFAGGEEGIDANFNGIVTKIKRGFLKKDFNSLSKARQKIIQQFVTTKPCPSCQGARLKKEVLDCRINGKNIYELGKLQLTELLDFFNSVPNQTVETVLEQLKHRTKNLVNIGIGYLNLERSTGTLSGGEAQRVQLAKQLGNSLTEMLYVLDEPSVGLHPRDVKLVADLLIDLKEKGNTILMVEHDPDLIKIADHVIDMGPKAGRLGGQVIFQGSYNQLLQSNTLTGQFMKQKIYVKTEFRAWTETFEIKNASANNLKGIDVQIPAKIFTCITGVAGSGKSSLIHKEFLKIHPEAIVIDQSPVGKSIRSNPATYTGVFDDIRDLFARSNEGTIASLFSFNKEGACENCNGLGYIMMDLAFMDPIKTTCEKCGGHRYNKQVESYLLDGKTIVDVLNLTISDALQFFKEPKILKKLQVLEEVGLDYLQLGQPLSTLSGGECQRVKLASELHKEGNIYIMDEPTTGLHLSDISKIIELIEKLVKKGNSVIVIEHSLDIMNNADWIIDIGPEGGSNGGKIVFEGTPINLQKKNNGYTAKYLKEYNKK